MPTSDYERAMRTSWLTPFVTRLAGLLYRWSPGGWLLDLVAPKRGFCFHEEPDPDCAVCRRTARRGRVTDWLVVGRLGVAALLVLPLADPGRPVVFGFAILLLYDLFVANVSHVLDEASRSGSGPAMRPLVIAAVNIVCFTFLFAALYEYSYADVDRWESLGLSWSAFTTVTLSKDLAEKNDDVIAAFEVATALFMLAVIVAFAVQGFRTGDAEAKG